MRTISRLCHRNLLAWAKMSIVVLAVALSQVSWAEEVKVSTKQQVMCLARNIYYEAGMESFEGKVAVAQVTLNRTAHQNFPKTVCEVVNQKTAVVKSEQVVNAALVTGSFFKQDEIVKTTETRWHTIRVCQFSWVCNPPAAIKFGSDRWKESVAIAESVILEGLRAPGMEAALYFHNTRVNPRWGLERITQIGNHIFYSDSQLSKRQKNNS